MKNSNVRETIKTIALTAIIAGVACFIAGHNYAQAEATKTQAAVHDALKAAATPAPVAQAVK
jgi:predicted transcriptional regulator